MTLLLVLPLVLAVILATVDVASSFSTIGDGSGVTRIVRTKCHRITNNLIKSNRERYYHDFTVSDDDAPRTPRRWTPMTSTSSPSMLRMTKGGNEGDGGATPIIAGILLLIFVTGSVLPELAPLLNGGATSGIGLSDSVITRQDDAAAVKSKFESLESNESMRRQISLSRTAIESKLSFVPVFYIVSTTTANDGEGGQFVGRATMSSTDIYLSYDDAVAATATSSSASSGSIGSMTVKGTTLDQVLYPLVLKRGRSKMMPPAPLEIQRAEAELSSDATATQTKKYRLVPSSRAVERYRQINDGETVSTSDAPLFVADRLAFAGPDGSPQLPLFLDENDCVASYDRLRSGKKSSSSLPETPTIRTSSLLQTVLSMEKGTRPGLNQLAFYATENDLIKVDELMSMKSK